MSSKIELIDFYIMERSVFFPEESELTEFEREILTKISWLFSFEDCKFLLDGYCSSYGLSCLDKALGLEVDIYFTPLLKHIEVIDKRIDKVLGYD